MNAHGRIPASAITPDRPVQVVLVTDIGCASSSVAHFSSRLLNRADQTALDRIKCPLRRKRQGLSRALVRWLIRTDSFREVRVAEFAWAKPGKPVFVSGTPHFSISYSGDEMAVAISRTGAVGIDIERITPRNAERMLTRVSSGRERKQSMHESNKLDVLYRLWTAKEALLKATGEGLAVPMASIDLGLFWKDHQESVMTYNRNSIGWSIATFFCAERSMAVAHCTAQPTDIGFTSYHACALADAK